MVPRIHDIKAWMFQQLELMKYEIKTWIRVFKMHQSPKHKDFILEVPYLQEDCLHHWIPNVPFQSDSNFSDVPDEVIILIFTFLDCRSLLLLSEVCRNFYHLSHRDIIWRDYLIFEKSKENWMNELEHIEGVPSQFNLTTEISSKISRLNNFYIPSIEEKIYLNFQNLPNTLDDSLTDIETDRGSSVVDHETIFSLQDIEDTIREQNEEERGKIVSVDETVSISSSELMQQEIDRLYGEYMEFRRMKLRHPFLRSKLIQIHTKNLKDRYRLITKWINHGKLLCSILFLVSTILVTLRLDDIITIWWEFLFVPILAFVALFMILVAAMWIPTLQWPIELYRWVYKDYVGIWTSWAYTLTVRGRALQLLLGIWVPSSIFFWYGHVIFPNLVPTWVGFAWIGLGFLNWTFTITQFRYPPAKKLYPFFFFTAGMSLVTLCVTIVLKLLIFDEVFSKVEWFYFYWSIACLPLIVTFLSIFFIHLKLTIDLNRIRSRHVSIGRRTIMCTLWNVVFTFVLFLCLLSTGLILLKIDLNNATFVRASFKRRFNSYYLYTAVVFPLVLLELLLISYYAVRVFGKKFLNASVYKNPFTLVSGGIGNQEEMDSYIV